MHAWTFSRDTLERHTRTEHATLLAVYSLQDRLHAQALFSMAFCINLCSFQIRLQLLYSSIGLLHRMVQVKGSWTC